MAIQGNWTKGHIDPDWGEYKQLDYRRVQFNDQVTVKRWTDAGHTYNNYTGELLDFQQLPTWALNFGKKFGENMGLDDLGISLYKMTPGCVLPVHQDTYALYKRIHNINHERILRVVIFVEDWQSGHYLEVDGQPIYEWHAGDWIAWKYSTRHIAANIGMTDRYTMQVTGIYEEDENKQYK